MHIFPFNSGSCVLDTKSVSDKLFLPDKHYRDEKITQNEKVLLICLIKHFQQARHFKSHKTITERTERMVDYFFCEFYENHVCSCILIVHYIQRLFSEWICPNSQIRYFGDVDLQYQASLHNYNNEIPWIHPIKCWRITGSMIFELIFREDCQLAIFKDHKLFRNLFGKKKYVFQYNLSMMYVNLEREIRKIHHVFFSPKRNGLMPQFS